MDRLAELNFEIEKLQREIRSTFADEQMLPRIGQGSAVRLAEIADERARLEDALRHQLKERNELTSKN